MMANTLKINTKILLDACANNMPDVALAIIETGEFDATENYKNGGNNSIMFACKNNMSEVVLEIMNICDIDVKWMNAEGENVITFACENKMFDVLEAIVLNEDGSTLLTIACEHEMTDLALIILARDPNCYNDRNISGESVLTTACKNKMTQVALAIIAIENTINVYDDWMTSTKINDKHTANAYACKNGMSDVALLLSKPMKKKRKFEK
jgi:ankyrin repeat protein